jgi:hypothetical protein
VYFVFCVFLQQAEDETKFESGGWRRMRGDVWTSSFPVGFPLNFLLVETQGAKCARDTFTIFPATIFCFICHTFFTHISRKGTDDDTISTNDDP